MATFQQDIYLTVLQARDYATAMGAKFIEDENNGEQPSKCCYMQLMLLIRWIRISEAYYGNNYNAQGNVAEPNFVCLTLAEMQELLAKIKAFIKVC